MGTDEGLPAQAAAIERVAQRCCRRWGCRRGVMSPRRKRRSRGFVGEVLQEFEGQDSRGLMIESGGLGFILNMGLCPLKSWRRSK